VAQHVGVGDGLDDLPVVEALRRNEVSARGAVAGSGQADRAAAVRIGRGPISSSTLQFNSARVRTLLANSTGWRA
jgi:hypothetical protein